MDVATLRDLFMWCTIINVGLLILSFVILTAAGDWVHRTHSRFFPISRDTFYVVMYSLLAAFKTIVIFFNLVPYLALSIIV